MKILVLNCGSSSIKYKLFDMTTKEVIAQGGIEKIGLKGSFLKLTLPNGEKKVLEKDIPEHTIGVEFILNTLISPEYGAIKSLDEINAVDVYKRQEEIDHETDTAAYFFTTICFCLVLFAKTGGSCQRI